MEAGFAVASAAGLGRLAEEVRAAASRAASAGGVEWSSTAAEHFRERLAHEAAAVVGLSELLDEASRAMAAHACAVQRAPLPVWW